MKDKILMFVIGILVGAVISTGAFFIYTKMTNTCKTNRNNQMKMPGGNPPSMQNEQGGQNGQSGQNGEPPAKPGESNTQNNNDSQSNNQINNN